MQQPQLLWPRAAALQHTAREQPEDHRRERGNEVQRQIAAAVVDKRPLARKQVEEPLVDPGGEVRVLVPVRREAGDVVRPVGADANGRRIESRQRAGDRARTQPSSRRGSGPRPASCVRGRVHASRKRNTYPSPICVSTSSNVKYVCGRACDRRKMPSAMSTKARNALCASMRENDWPFARRLAIE